MTAVPNANMERVLALLEAVARMSRHKRGWLDNKPKPRIAPFLGLIKIYKDHGVDLPIDKVSAALPPQVDEVDPLSDEDQRWVSARQDDLANLILRPASEAAAAVETLTTVSIEEINCYRAALGLVGRLHVDAMNSHRASELPGPDWRDGLAKMMRIIIEAEVEYWGAYHELRRMGFTWDAAGRRAVAIRGKNPEHLLTGLIERQYAVLQPVVKVGWGVTAKNNEIVRFHICLILTALGFTGDDLSPRPRMKIANVIDNYIEREKRKSRT